MPNIATLPGKKTLNFLEHSMAAQELHQFLEFIKFWKKDSYRSLQWKKKKKIQIVPDELIINLHS